MPQAIIYIDEELDKKIEEFSKKLNISKHDTILRILHGYKFEVKSG
jgi:hypothetical protein